MKLLNAALTLSLLILPTIAFAQQPSNQPSEYNLKIKATDIDKIGRGLAKLPFEDVAELMQNLRNQVVEQQQPKAEPKPEEAPKPVKPKKGK